MRGSCKDTRSLTKRSVQTPAPLAQTHLVSEYSHGKTVFFLKKLNYFFFHPSQSLSSSHPLSLKHYLRVLDCFRTYLCHSGHFCKLCMPSFLTCQREANAIHIRYPLPSFVSCFCEPHQQFYLNSGSTDLEFMTSG